MPLTKSERYERAKRLVNEDFDYRRRTFQTYFRAQAGFYDMFRGYWEGRRDSTYNNVHIPMTFSVIMSDVAAMMQIEFGGQTAIQAVPTGPEDFSDARKSERLLDNQFYQSRHTKKFTRLFLHGDLYGVGVAQSGWRIQYGSQTREAAQEYGRGARYKGATNLKFDGPDIRVVDPPDFFPEPGFMDIEDMNSVLHRWYSDREAVQLRALLGPNGEAPIYDPDQVREFLNSYSPRTPEMVPTENQFLRSMAAGGMPEKGHPRPPQLFESVEILERWGRVPYDWGMWFNVKENIISDTEIPDSRYVTDFVITLANRTHVLRCVPIPHADTDKPFFAYKPHEDAHHFHPPGKCELMAKLNAAGNKMVSSQLDALDLAVNGPVIANMYKFDRRRLKQGLRPGGTIWSDGPTSEQDLRPYLADFRGVGTAAAEIEFINRLIQQVSGRADDVAQGIAVSKRQSATEFQGRTDAVAVRVGLQSRLAEAEVIEPLASHWWNLNRQFLPVPLLVRQIGANAFMDPVTGRFMRPELDVFTDLDLVPDYNWRATGATRQLGKYSRQQSIAQITPVLMPFAQMGMLNAQIFLRQILPVFDFTNVDELVGTQDLVTQAMLMWVQQYVQGGPQGSPEGARGTFAPQIAQRALKLPGREVAPAPMQEAVAEEVGT